VVLVEPKYPHNIGTALRAAACFNIPQLWVSGERVLQEVNGLKRLPREERLRGYQDVELAYHPDPLSVLVGECTPIAVEFRAHAQNLFDFQHHPNAIYVFGPEDGTLHRNILTRCHRFVVIDTAHCLNLGSAVSIVLYDRALKEHASRLAGATV
jgi:tRNA(Leu) C34 or U34 (ribose-2'-O)-methylase TrmL